MVGKSAPKLFDGSQELYEMSEDGLHQYFRETVRDDFYTAHEVTGTCFVNHPSLEKAKVRADFLLYPKQHLLDAGFANTWFAVEIKAGKYHLSKGFRQAFWYTLSTFQIKDRLITPGFAVLWAPSAPQRGEVTEQQKDRQDWFEKGERSAFGYLNVGFMKLHIKGYSVWDISFYAGDNYARRYTTPRDYASGKDGLITVNRNGRSFGLRYGSDSKAVTHSGLTGQESTAS